VFLPNLKKELVRQDAEEGGERGLLLFSNLWPGARREEGGLLCLAFGKKREEDLPVGARGEDGEG